MAEFDWEQDAELSREGDLAKDIGPAVGYLGDHVDYVAGLTGCVRGLHSVALADGTVLGHGRLTQLHDEPSWIQWNRQIR